MWEIRIKISSKKCKNNVILMVKIKINDNFMKFL